VIIDGTYSEEDGKRVYKERSGNEIEKFTLLVKNAVGFSADRGDKLEVTNVAFSADEAFDEQVAFPERKRDLILTIVNHSLIGVGLLLFALFVLRPLIKWLTSEPAYESVAELAGMLPSGIGDLEERYLGAGDGEERPGSLPPGGASKDDTDTKMKDLMERRERMKANASQDKKAIAAMLKKWLKEDDQSK